MNDICLMCLEVKAQYVEKTISPDFRLQYCFKCWFVLAELSFKNWHKRYISGHTPKDDPLIFNRDKII